MNEKVQVSIIDSEGFFREPFLVKRDRMDIELYDTLIEEDGTETKFLKPYIVIDEVPQGLHKPKWNGTAWVEGKIETELLEQAKKAKIHQLRSECEKAILGYFKATVDTVEYSFSNDAEAQSNFKDGIWALEGNKVTSVKWTCYDASGDVVRLDLDLAKISDVNIARLMHKEAQVAKFRDTLQPQVEAATTISEVQAVVW